jgi:hypothetical protein
MTCENFPGHGVRDQYNETNAIHMDSMFQMGSGVSQAGELRVSALPASAGERKAKLSFTHSGSDR